MTSGNNDNNYNNHRYHNEAKQLDDPNGMYLSYAPSLSRREVSTTTNETIVTFDEDTNREEHHYGLDRDIQLQSNAMMLHNTTTGMRTKHADYP